MCATVRLPALVQSTPCYAGIIPEVSNRTAKLAAQPETTAALPAVSDQENIALCDHVLLALYLDLAVLARRRKAARRE